MDKINDEVIKELGLQPSIELFEFIRVDWVLTPNDVANLTGMGVITIRRWCREGKILSYQFQYVITGKESKKFLKGSKIQSKFI